MDAIGLDLHQHERQLGILTAEGAVIEPRIRMIRERVAEVLGSRPPARILLDASTPSEWVARCLEALGHEGIVADPNVAPPYATRSRRVTTDGRDARMLAAADRPRADRPAHRLSEAHRHGRAELAVHDALVRTRTRSIARLTSVLRRAGLRVPSGAAAAILPRLARVEFPTTLQKEPISLPASEKEQSLLSSRPCCVRSPQK